MSNKELEALLKCIRDLALLPYPFPPGSRASDEYCLALGQIAGLAEKALRTHQNRDKGLAK